MLALTAVFILVFCSSSIMLQGCFSLMVLRHLPPESSERKQISVIFFIHASSLRICCCFFSEDHKGFTKWNSLVSLIVDILKNIFYKLIAARRWYFALPSTVGNMHCISFPNTSNIMLPMSGCF